MTNQSYKILNKEDDCDCCACKVRKAKIYQEVGDYCLLCWQKRTEPDV